MTSMHKVQEQTLWEIFKFNLKAALEEEFKKLEIVEEEC